MMIHLPKSVSADLTIKSEINHPNKRRLGVKQVDVIKTSTS